MCKILHYIYTLKRRAAALVELNNNKTFHVLTLHNNLWLAILFLKALLLHMGLIGIHLFIHIVECKITHAIIITSARHIPSYPRYVMLIHYDCTFIIDNFTLVFHRSLSLSLSFSLSSNLLC